MRDLIHTYLFCATMAIAMVVIHMMLGGGI
jgi:hypothetical protein